jgi:SAM-dependent methyltransferase
VFDAFLQGDINRLPLRDASIAGVWNLGVLEHFDEPAGIRILQEFRRVLTPGGHAVLFWPPDFGSSRLVLAPIEKLRSLARGSAFRFFPDEVNRLTSRSHARRLLAAAGLEEILVDFSFRDLFIHVVVVARRPS